ncbi:variant leucine-rich repeat-containing protein [Brachybacterium paraconglomeratum]|uniref:variant leucine-rich repeat-containing protein n=1 Tax=Brachybacterium paraconglomeratum TaxID=173362 RepID=UPI0021A8B6CD|nr:hypothetical protein [Brachybacterium paraconglomeratum]MCT1910691.1 hypothetical protein [Brachybacterium paraconglomeratum]
MAEHRSTAEEAADPGTSPERLLELTEKHPQLHRLIVMNPSAPEVARQWILATNQWAKQAYEAGTLQPDEDDDLDKGEPTQLHQVVPDEDQAPEESARTAATQPDPDDSASASDEVPEALVWGTAAGATGAAAADAAGAGAARADASADERPGTTPPPAPPAQQAPAGGPAPAAQPSPSAQPPAEGSPSVRLSPNASVVPLGAAPASQTSPAAQTSPASQASPAPAAGPPTRQMPAVAATAASTGAAASAAQHPAGPQGTHGQQYPYGEQGPSSPGPASQGPASAPPPVGRPPQEEDHSDDGSRKRALIACGGCLVLALILLLVIGLGARALFAPDEEQYQRDSSTTSAEAAPEETTAEETTEETTEDPVSPAPEGAEEMSELRSPTGNISCHLEEDSVSCSLVERDFSEAGLEDCENGPFSITVAGEDAERACGSSFLSDSAPTLEYDRSAQRGDVACTSRFDGMTCWNVMTGKGFTVNKVSYETF